MNLRPLQDWAVIGKSEPEEKTAGGIIIPEVAKEKPLEGTIVAIGPGRYKLEKGKEKEKKKKFVPTVLKPGQKVIYQRYAEREIELGSEVITLVREEDILGTIEDYGIAEKKTHALEGKKEGSVAIRAKAHVPLVTPAKVSAEKPATAEKRPTAKKPSAKKAASETPSPKKEKPRGKKVKDPKKAAAKKPVTRKPAKDVRKKTVGKVATKMAPKKAKPAATKSVPKKSATKKAAAKPAAKKKTAQKKTVKPAAKKTVVKKTAEKTHPKSKGKKK
jgi:chaperonin GroES